MSLIKTGDKCSSLSKIDELYIENQMLKELCVDLVAQGLDSAFGNVSHDFISVYEEWFRLLGIEFSVVGRDEYEQAVEKWMEA
jgi:hypothetical protein